MDKRSSGILLHISSLPGKYGIGDFGESAYNFVDFLETAGQRYWQILPLGVTSYGDSPYQCFSAFAGNPYFIDLDEFIEQGYLTGRDIERMELGDDPSCVDYGLLYKNKMKLLRMAYETGKQELGNELYNFYKQHKDWLREFAVYMGIKAKNGNLSWMKWSAEYRHVNSKSVREFEVNNEEEIYFWVFTQYFFFKQWLRLKQYANEKDIHIIGDLPIYVAEDSADVWGNPEIFKLDSSLKPTTVSGCPPDAFSDTGQLWGNPVYNWEVLEERGYDWWLKRIEHSFKLYDTLRIDHFRGFESFWEINSGSETAINGQWTKGPGIKLFDEIKAQLGELDIIAEDLGFITEEVRELINKAGYPGMKVLQFAFDSREESDYLPHNYDKNCVVYTGTHDNHTAMGWFDNVSKQDFIYAVNYLKLNYDEGLNWGFIRGAWSSVAYLAIAPLQDFLGLGDEARFNVPSTIGGNWTWRVKSEQLTEGLAQKIHRLNQLYGR